MRKKIVITGISSAIVQEFASQIDVSKFELIGISRNPDAVRLNNIEIIKGEFQNTKEISALLDECYMLIHTAAITHTRKEKEYYQINLHATEKLVKAAKKHKVERFVFISSNAAGETSGAYGLTKLLAEQYIKQEFDGWTILRLSEVFGSAKNEGIEKLINDVLNKSMVLCPTNLPSKLCPIHIEDAARIMFDHVFNMESINNSVVICGPEEFSYSEVVKLTRRISGKKVKAILLGRRIMFLIKWIVKLSPIDLGIVPDQIDRLYSKKNIVPDKSALGKLEVYIAELMEEGNSQT